MKKVLLINPPGRRVYLRDYFCSKVSQADYLNHPIDFVFLSGWLRGRFEVDLIDAIVEKLTVPETLNQAQQLSPDFVIGLIASVSYDEDVAFYRRLRAALPPHTKLILIGDILIDRREARLAELEFADAFLHDFATSDIVKYLEEDEDSVSNMTLRVGDVIVARPLLRANQRDLELPPPDHRLFAGRRYRYPFVRRKRFATIMTEYGCPYRCTFCIMSTLGWVIRPVENVLQELDEIKDLGIRELFLLDQTFGIQKKRAEELLYAMQQRYDFGWVCFSRPDVLTGDLLRQMKAAGCHTVIVGLESGDQQVLDAAQKDYELDEIVAGFRRCRQHGLRTVATVILGLPQETEESFARTLAMLEQVDCDFASFNVAVPRMGTPLREQALQSQLIDDDFQIMDQSGTPVAMPAFQLSRDQIQDMKKRAIRAFYFNARYLGRRLSRIRSRDELAIQLRQGISLLRNYVRSS